jgi:hypothetical protein
MSSFNTETTEATKTTELNAYVLAVAGIAVTAFTPSAPRTAPAGWSTTMQDFGRERVWLYIAMLTVGYMVSRGLAKTCSYEPDEDDD